MASRFARAGHLRTSPVQAAVQGALGDAERAGSLAGAVAVDVDEDDRLAEALGQRGDGVEHLASAAGAHGAVFGADVDGLEVLGQRGGARAAGGGAQAAEVRVARGLHEVGGLAAAHGPRPAQDALEGVLDEVRGVAVPAREAPCDPRPALPGRGEARGVEGAGTGAGSGERRHGSHGAICRGIGATGTLPCLSRTSGGNPGCGGAAARTTGVAAGRTGSTLGARTTCAVMRLAAHYHRARSGPGPVPRPAFKAGGAVRSRLEGSTPSPLRHVGTLDAVSAAPLPGVDLLLERERELRCIGAAIAAAREGSGRSVVVEGPAGIGKSAVLAAARMASEDAATRFLRARGAELERDFAFGVVRQLFEPMLHEASAAERADLLQGPARLAARVLGLPGALEEGEAPAAAPDASFAVLHGLYWLCANLAANQLVVLSVDDAHWADASSLRFLAFLMPRLQELRIALLVAARPEAEVEEAHLLATLPADPHADVVHPAPLSVGAVGRLVEAHLDAAPEEAFTAACHRATGGVPFLVRELVEAVGREGMTPDARTAARVEGVGASTARRWIQLRLGRLPAPAARLARAVAVLERAQLPRAAALAELDPAQAAEAADALVAAGILEPERPQAFIHPLVRAGVYEELGGADRSHAHRRAAELMDDDPAGEERAAEHLLATEPAGDAS